MTEDIFVLTHGYSDKDDHPVHRFIGLYATKAEAKAVRELLKRRPGFAEYSDRFILGKAELGSFGWEEGFFSW